MFLLVGICYLLSVLELDSNECKQNYGKEQHSHITASKTNDIIYAQVLIADLPKNFINFLGAKVVLFEKAASPAYASNPDPPGKRFILHSALLI